MPTGKTVSISQSPFVAHYLRAHSISWPTNHSEQQEIVSGAIRWAEKSFAQQLGVSEQYLARILGTDERTLRRWLADINSMPENVTRILQFFVENREVFLRFQNYISKGWHKR